MVFVSLEPQADEDEMKLYTCVADGQARIGVRLKERIIELSHAAAAVRVPRKLPAKVAES